MGIGLFHIQIWSWSAPGIRHRFQALEKREKMGGLGAAWCTDRWRWCANSRFEGGEPYPSRFFGTPQFWDALSWFLNQGDFSECAEELRFPYVERCWNQHEFSGIEVQLDVTDLKSMLMAVPTWWQRHGTISGNWNKHKASAVSQHDLLSQICRKLVVHGPEPLRGQSLRRSAQNCELPLYNECNEGSYTVLHMLCKQCWMIHDLTWMLHLAVVDGSLQSASFQVEVLAKGN